MNTSPGSPTRCMRDPTQFGWPARRITDRLPSTSDMDLVSWPADPISKIVGGASGGVCKPPCISPYEDIGAVWRRLRDCVKRPPAARDATVQDGNDYHRHRDPEGRRVPDSEGLCPSL